MKSTDEITKEILEEVKKDIKEEVTCTAIRIELSNGRMLMANGSDAAKIWKWWWNTEMIASLRGAEYKGPKLKEWKMVEEEQ